MNDPRLAALGEARSYDLSLLVACRLDATRAARMLTEAGGRGRKGGNVLQCSLITRIDRAAAKLGFKRRLDLLVWHELEANGQQRAEAWRKRLSPRFALTDERKDALDLLDRLLVLTNEGADDRLRRLANEFEISSRTVTRRLQRFAKDAKIEYSVHWLVFLYALHKQLNTPPRRE